MRTVSLTVQTEYVAGAGVVAGAEGTSSTTVRVEFIDWSGLSKYATTRNAKGENPTVTVLTTDKLVPETEDTYEFEIPSNAMDEEGLMSITFTGYEVENGNETSTVTNTATAKLRVLPSDYMPADDGSVTPTIAQQLQAEIDEIKDDIIIATHAQEYAEAAAASASSASGSATDADASATEAESYAHGGTESRSGEDTDNAKYYAEEASESAQDSASSAVLAESWAVGGTGEREGEDTNNSKYWCEQAHSTVTGVISFNSRTGDVLPESGDYDITDISNNGTLGQVPMSDGQGGFTMGTPAGDLDDLNDVDITTPAGGQVLGYNATSQKWENTNPSKGHTIKDQTGTAATQRDNLQFKDMKVSDDSTNGATKLEAVQEITESELNNLGSGTDGIYLVPDGSAEPMTAQNLLYRPGTTTKQALDRIEDNFANVENNVTSSQAYTVGEHITRGDKYYRVKAAIAQGDSFVENTNIERANVGGEIEKLSSNLAKHDLGTPINVSPYENTPYTVPSDGYVWCEASGAIANAKIKIGSGVNTFEAIACGNTGRGGRATVFVRKDTVVTVSVEGGTLYQAWFYPLA